MAMTRKDYVSVANILNVELLCAELTPENSIETLETIRYHINSIANTFCKVASADNSNFDKARFLGACGL